MHYPLFGVGTGMAIMGLAILILLFSGSSIDEFRIVGGIIMLVSGIFVLSKGVKYKKTHI